MGYEHYMAEIIAIYVIAATGLNIALGYAGQAQLGQAAIMAISAYAAAIASQAGLDQWVVLPVGLVAGLVMGCCVAALCARLNSHYLLLATFALDVAVVGLLRAFPNETGGPNGMPALSVITFFDTPLIGSTPLYTIVICVIAALAVWISFLVKRSYLGLAMEAVRQSERSAIASGVGVNKVKFAAVFIGGAYASVAGLLMGPIVTFLAPESFGLELTVLLLLMVIVGGAGSILGVVLAAIVLSLASQIAQTATVAWPLGYGIFVMAILIVSNKGLGGLLPSFNHIFRSGSNRSGAEATAETGSSSGPTHSANLEGTDLVRAFAGVRAVDGVSIKAEPGRVIGLMGPNGSGKTTLFELLSGFSRSDRGKISLSGRQIESTGAADRARLGIARSFQHAAIMPESTVFENVMVGILRKIPTASWIRAVSSQGRDFWTARVNAALATLGLSDVRDQRAGDLPYGRQKLVDLARVIVAEPSVALLDEPLAGAGASSIGFVQRAVSELRQRTAAVVIVEHNVPFMRRLCDSLLVLSAGRLIAAGTADTVLKDEAVIDAYLGRSSKLHDQADTGDA